jgi:hypothetical protein
VFRCCMDMMTSKRLMILTSSIVDLTQCIIHLTICQIFLTSGGAKQKCRSEKGAT